MSGFWSLSVLLKTLKKTSCPGYRKTQAHIIADGSSGRFIDKPHFIFVPDDLNSQTYREETIAVDGRDITVRTPSGTLVVAYAVFTGSSSVKVGVQTSIDGVNWTHFTKLSESLNQVTGVSLTAIGQKAWSQRGDARPTTTTATQSCAPFRKTAGKTWTKAEVAFNLCPFDQPATGVSFRTFAFPWSANDGDRFWIFSTDRFFEATGGISTSCDAIADLPGVFDGIPRIVGMSSTDGHQLVWRCHRRSGPGRLLSMRTWTPVASRWVPRSCRAASAPRTELISPGTTLAVKSQDCRCKATARLKSKYHLSTITPAVTEQSLAKVLRKADVWMTRLTASADCEAIATDVLPASNPRFVCRDIL